MNPLVARRLSHWARRWLAMAAVATGACPAPVFRCYHGGVRTIAVWSGRRLAEPSQSSSPPERHPNPIFGYETEIDGQTIHYETSGEGEHVLLLLPGALGTGKTDFLPQLTGLDGTRFKVVAWDPPGYGQSRPPERDFNDFYRRDAHMAGRLMETLGHPRYSVLGWSDGGVTGLILAAARPESLRKLIVWGANAYVCDEDREALRRVRDARNWSERMRQPMVEIYGEQGFHRLWDRFVSHMLTTGDICKEDLKRIECPVLILHGDQDPMVAREHPVYLVNHIPNGTLYRFPQGKHNIHQRYADEFNKLCEDFLSTK